MGNILIGVRTDVDVSIIMPCLNEAGWLAACIANAREALDGMRETYGLSGEIIVADNGSTDGSSAIAERLGARCVDIPKRGYGAALAGGAEAAFGRFLVMGDADGSYDFRDSVVMVGELMDGADVCMGSRFKGRIEPGAMPWKNRYIGNPVLTGILNLLFRSGISDAHCGLRALTKTTFDRLKLTGDGMEFASEMVIKATLIGCRIAEAPATLSRDLRDRPPHLRPWRDGWRHLRYLLMLSPTWTFALPAAILTVLAVAILGLAGFTALRGDTQPTYVGNYWVILAGACLIVAHSSLLLAAAGSLYGIREGYRRPSELVKRFAQWVSLESMLIMGGVCVLVGGAILAVLLRYWSARGYLPISNVLPAVLGTALLAIGAQNILGGFLIAIVNGNNADFARAASAPQRATPLNARAMPPQLRNEAA